MSILYFILFTLLLSMRVNQIGYGGGVWIINDEIYIIICRTLLLVPVINN